MANLRPGMNDFFPTAAYIAIMSCLLKGPQFYSALYRAASAATTIKSVGVQLDRMCEHGLIQKREEKRGLYEITDYGKKILKAVDAYRRELHS